MVFAYMILALVAGLRFRLGSDAYAYEYYINNTAVGIMDIDSGDVWDGFYQPGWVVLTSIAKSLGHYLYLQMFVSFVSVFSVYFFLKKNTNFFASSTLFFFISFYHYFSVEILREALAISIFLGAMTVFKERKVVSFVLCCASILFHKFAVLTIFIYILLTFNFGLKRFVLFISIIILASVYFKNPLSVITVLYSAIGTINFETYELGGEMSVFGVLLYTSKILLPLIAILYGYKRRHVISMYIPPRVFYIFCGLTSSIYLIRLISFPYVERLNNYFIIFVITYSATLTIIFLKKQTFVVRNCLFIFIFFGAVIFNWLPLMKPNVDGLPGYAMYYPYSSYLNPSIDESRQSLLYSRFGNTE